MRLQWPDGAIVAVWFMPKGANKSVVTVAHPKLPDKSAAEKARRFWTDRLEALDSLLTS
jgi:hypothetical protein